MSSAQVLCWSSPCKSGKFPVGRVEFLYLYPLNFREYLKAIDKQSLLEQLEQLPVKPFAHQAGMDVFHRYASF